MWAVVPLKSPETAKSRLSDVLNPAQRARLFSVLARHVVRTLVATPGIERVVVATASESVCALARSCGAHTLRLQRDAGTAQACTEALQQLQGQRLERVMFVAGDIPLISPAALAPLTLASEDCFAALVPDRKRVGTNILLCAPPGAVPICFGPASFDKHVSAARQRGVPLHVIDSPALSLDIDSTDDLQELQRRVELEQCDLASDLRPLLASHTETALQ